MSIDAGSYGKRVGDAEEWKREIEKEEREEREGGEGGRRGREEREGGGLPCHRAVARPVAHPLRDPVDPASVKSE